jgi:hypothetical protein
MVVATSPIGRALGAVEKMKDENGDPGGVAEWTPAHELVERRLEIQLFDSTILGVAV